MDEETIRRIVREELIAADAAKQARRAAVASYDARELLENLARAPTQSNIRFAPPTPESKPWWKRMLCLT